MGLKPKPKLRAFQLAMLALHVGPLHGQLAMLLNSRSEMRAVRILGMQAACCRNRARSHRNRQEFVESGSCLAEIGPKPVEFMPSVPEFGPNSTKSGQFGSESAKFGPNSTRFGQRWPGIVKKMSKIDQIWLGAESAKVGPIERNRPATDELQPKFGHPGRGVVLSWNAGLVSKSREAWRRATARDGRGGTAVGPRSLAWSAASKIGGG